MGGVQMLHIAFTFRRLFTQKELLNVEHWRSLNPLYDFLIVRQRGDVCTVLDLPDDLVVDHEKDPGLDAQGRQLLVGVQQRALRDVRGRAYHTGHAQNNNLPELTKNGR